MTHRQYAAWQEWLSAQWNVPNRSDHYAMQVAAEVARTPGRFTRSPPKIKLDQFRIPFVDEKPKPFVKRPGGPPGPLTKEEVAKFKVSMRKAQIEAQARFSKDKKLR